MNKKFIRVLAGLGFAHLAISPQASSQEKINQLSEVVVTASRSPRKQSETGKVVRVISSQQLAQSQGRSLPELLNNVAGLTMTGSANHPGELKSLYLRGSSRGNTLILIDGIAVNDASNISGEYDISAIAIDQIERIEILKGGNSTLYGSDAVAGVINIITKKAVATKLNAGIISTGGSYGSFKQAVSVNGSLGSTQVALNASNLHSKGFSVAEATSATQTLERDGFRQQGLSVNLRQAFNQKFSLNANVQANFNKSDMDDDAFADNADAFSDKKSSLIGLGGKYIVGNAVLDFNLSHNKVDNQFESYGSLTRNIGKITNLEANLSTPLSSNLDLISGWNYKRSATDQQSPWGDLQADNHIFSAFSSLFFKFSEQFRTELGGRLNRHNVYGNNATYTINPSYLIAGKYKFFVNLSSAFKVPSLYQLFSEFGNLELKPERTRTTEIGADIELIPGTLRFNVAYFDRNTQDAIDFGLVGTDFKYVNKNQQKDHGFELEWDYRPGKIWGINGFYAYVTGKQNNNGQELKNLFLRPKHSAGLTLSAQFANRWSGSLISKWVGERIEQYYSSAQQATVTADLKSYLLMDAYVQYLPKKNLTLFADVKNILDADYVERTGYTTRGINFNAGLKLDIH